VTTGEIGRGLQREEFGIVTRYSHELIMGSCFFDAAALQDINAVRVRHTRKSVRDQQHRTARKEASDAFE
jgi:hypothetical protein